MEYLRTFKFLFGISRSRKILSSLQPRYCSNLARTIANSRETQTTAKKSLSSGPAFQDFIKGVLNNKTNDENVEYHGHHSYFSDALDMKHFRKGQVFFGLF